ncbi:MAG: tyrosine-type recombinase/integrase, partial [Verrucomicrobia bacterium]|nr:tyrosine-type recombinase/integrase [Verrucomicrobiota bacterium]
TICSRRLSSLPTGLSEHQLDALLAAFDCGTPIGLRGYAATLCMVRLGLRVGEVARMEIDDIDWRAGVLRVVGGKGRRSNVLPLPKDVGDAIVQYLREGRPSTGDRHIFTRHRQRKRSPVRGGNRAGIRKDLYRAFKRAGLMIPTAGSTRALRHTTATNLLQRGATLKEIADILGHRSLDTTSIYAKVDLPSLRAVAMPWSGEEQ